jgi:hypothetical protein
MDRQQGKDDKDEMVERATESHPPCNSLVQEIAHGANAVLKSTSQACPKALKNAYEIVPDLLGEIILCEIDLVNKEDQETRNAIIDARKTAFEKLLKDNERKFRELGLYVLLWHLVEIYDWNEKLGRQELHYKIMNQLPEYYRSKLLADMPWNEKPTVMPPPPDSPPLDPYSFSEFPSPEKTRYINLQKIIDRIFDNINDCDKNIRILREVNLTREEEYAIAENHKTSHLEHLKQPEVRADLIEAGIFYELENAAHIFNWGTEAGICRLQQLMMDIKRRSII